MVCFIRQLPVDVWSHVMPMLSLKYIGRLDSAAAGGATRMILHENIFPRSPGRSFWANDKGQTAVEWCLNRGVVIKELNLRCVEEEDRLLKVVALHTGCVRHIFLQCDNRANLIRTLRRLNVHALDEQISLGLLCRSGFAQAEQAGLTAEETAMCQRLKSIWFDGQHEVPCPGAIKWLTNCFDHIPALGRVRVRYVRNLTVNVFKTAAFRSASLTSLNFRRCNVTNAMAQCIAETCKHLRSLSICENAAAMAQTASLGATDRVELLSDCGLIAIAKGCQSMQDLYLDHQSTHPAFLEAFALLCPKLRTMYAPQCALSAVVLNALATRCRSLTSLSVTWAVTPEECVVAEGLHKLKSLTLKVDSTRPTNLAKALQHIARLLNGLSEFNLNGEGLVPAAQCDAVGAALVDLARANPEVADVHLIGLSTAMLGDGHLTTVAQCWPKLRLLQVTSGLSDAALTAFAQHCPDLLILMIAGADPPNTDRSIRMLAKHCSKLEHVELPLAHQVTEEAFTELVRCCPQLEFLLVPPTISTEAMERIAAAKSGNRVYVRQ